MFLTKKKTFVWLEDLQCERQHTSFSFFFGAWELLNTKLLRNNSLKSLLVFLQKKNVGFEMQGELMTEFIF